MLTNAARFGLQTCFGHIARPVRGSNSFAASVNLTEVNSSISLAAPGRSTGTAAYKGNLQLPRIALRACLLTASPKANRDRESSIRKPTNEGGTAPAAPRLARLSAMGKTSPEG